MRPAPVRPPTDTDQGLAAAVINHALIDLMSSSRSYGMVKARLEARLFLTEAAGQWADARGFWCDLAGVHSERVRQRAMQMAADYDVAAVVL